jgi:hypothetical protein
MTRELTATKAGEGAGVRRDADEGGAEADEGGAEADEVSVEEASDFDRTFRLALVAYAVVEFIAVALFVYYRLAR